MTDPQYPQQQPGPYGPPPGGQPQQPYGQPGQPNQYGTPPQGYPAQPGQPGQPGDPYAQQPYAGQPGQPGPYGPPPAGMPGQPMPYGAPMPPKKGKAGKIIGAIVSFVVLAGIIIVVKVAVGGGLSALTEPSAKPGDCASVTGTTFSPKYKKVDCSAPEANYFIAKAMNSTSEACPSEDYAEYTESGRRSSSLKLCLVEKLEEGKCYEEELVKMNMEGMKPVDCSKGGNEFAVQKIFKIEKVVREGNAQCATGEPISYAEPAPGITYCITALGGQ
ncbi:LppU/SCO3897 family protein [Lentzea sp. CA-135723]|uniref:LppU/SCO3897 family protein n=1 Tax=Lentzea sp. CA-135723 TaxID=3239950 RepID=UPI003D90AA7D